MFVQRSTTWEQNAQLQYNSIEKESEALLVKAYNLRIKSVPAEKRNIILAFCFVAGKWLLFPWPHPPIYHLNSYGSFILLRQVLPLNCSGLVVGRLSKVRCNVGLGGRMKRTYVPHSLIPSSVGNFGVRYGQQWAPISRLSLILHFPYIQVATGHQRVVCWTHEHKPTDVYKLVK